MSTLELWFCGITIVISLCFLLSLLLFFCFVRTFIIWGSISKNILKTFVMVFVHIKSCSELFGSLRAFTPWLEALSSSLRQSPSTFPPGTVTLFNNIITSMLGCIFAIEEVSAKSKVLIVIFCWKHHSKEFDEFFPNTEISSNCEWFDFLC